MFASANAYTTRCIKCRGFLIPGEGLREGRNARGKAAYRHRGAYDGRRCSRTEVITRKVRTR